MIAATDYWQRHYAGEFRFGEGTEDILAALMTIPPVRTWVDLGAGSESLLWAIALRAHRLIAVDLDPWRLTILRQFAAGGQPRPVHSTALALCGRADPDAFQHRCASLHATVRADCLGGELPADPHLTASSADLLTQFGLLGLTRDPDHFTRCFRELHQLLAPGGWTAGANWVARCITGRVELTEQLYRHAAARTGIQLALLHRIVTADPDYPAVWLYVGRTASCPPPTPARPAN